MQESIESLRGFSSFVGSCLAMKDSRSKTAECPNYLISSAYLAKGEKNLLTIWWQPANQATTGSASRKGIHLPTAGGKGDNYAGSTY
ncbi:hypothetical protein [Agrobacterium larrymoorei]|uniref:hypothetical protein n=1 Tax=Agrobacterium larrymoorei TaxID=160699 RepID=UPI0030C13B5B